VQGPVGCHEIRDDVLVHRDELERVGGHTGDLSNGSDVISNGSDVMNNRRSVDLRQLLSQGLGIAVVRRANTEACRGLRRLVVDHHHLQSHDYNVIEPCCVQE
jgi:hypothetical protein